ncbi:hypothetical protein HanPSC8_Chr05g0196161 [Helianthus annuus]|nr:hypothetical protein HanPSC8_Chr05g0196161 [Helianthus annuus]
MSYLPLLLLKPIKVRELGPTFFFRFVLPIKLLNLTVKQDCDNLL